MGERKRKEKGRENKRKKDVLLEEGHQIYVSLTHADFSDISLFPPPLSVSHTKPPHKISQIKTLSISASPHLTAHKGFYFMKPKWNGYIKGHMVIVLPYTLNNNRETDRQTTHTLAITSESYFTLSICTKIQYRTDAHPVSHTPLTFLSWFVSHGLSV